MPLGKLSDLIDRRIVTAVAALVTATVAFVSMHLTLQDYAVLVLLAFLFGGLSIIPIHPDS